MENNLNDVNLERIVLGSILSDSSVFFDVKEILSIDCFTIDAHRATFSAILDTFMGGEDVTLTSVALKLKNGLNLAFLSQIINEAEFSNIITYSKHLAELRIRRDIINLGEYLVSKSKNHDIDISDTIGYADSSLSGILSNGSLSISTLKDAISGVIKIAERNATSDSILTGTPTGIDEFDRKSGGLQSTDLIIVAAETSQGKSSLAISIMTNAAKIGSKVAMYSLEMKKEQIAARIMSIESNIPSNEILFSKLNIDQFKHIDKSVSSLCNLPIYFDDNSTSSIDNIISSIRTLKMKYNIDGAIIDYLQILNVNMKGHNKEQQMADVARRLKNLAKDLDIWIMALSQLNRNQDNPIPNLNRLRDSGQIAEAADIVMFIYRPEYYGRSLPDPFQNIDERGMAMIDIAKGRNIGILKFLLNFDAKTTHFTNPNGFITKSATKNDTPF